VKVLFVCTANSCRSQMAETWAHHLFPENWVVNSAGLLTHRITSRTRKAMAEVGLDMAGQHSKTFDELDLDSYDLCVTLSQSSSKYFPELAGEVFRGAIIKNTPNPCIFYLFNEIQISLIV